MKNKLIFVQWGNAFGGLEKITKDLERAFNKYNPLVVVLRYSREGFNYKNMYTFKKKNKLLFIAEYITFISKNKANIFHLQLVGTIILFLTYIGGAKKITYHFHGTYSNKNFFERLIWKYLENKIIVIANSKQTKSQIIKKYNIKKNIFIIPNLINEQEFIYSERRYNGEKFIITYAGRLAKGKNLILLLNTAKKFINNSEVEFRIFGDGPERENLINKISELSIGKNTRILPFTKDVLRVYKESHLFIFPSLFESFGNVVAEAILTGLPILCFKIPSLTEIIDDDFFFFSEQNPDLIKKRIIEIKTNYSLATEKLKLVEKKLRIYLDNKKIVDGINHLYEKLERKNEFK